MKLTIITPLLATVVAAIPSYWPANWQSSGNNSPLSWGTSPSQNPPSGSGSSSNNGWVSGSTSSNNGTCITQDEANTFINTYIAVYTKTDPDFAETAKTILTSNFTEFSASINMLFGRAPTFNNGENLDSRALFIEYLTDVPQATASDVTTLDTLVVCDKILWYFSFGQVGGGNGRFPVEGGILFYLVRTGDGKLQAEKAAIEFNSLAWALDIGFTCQYPNGTQV